MEPPRRVMLFGPLALYAIRCTNPPGDIDPGQAGCPGLIRRWIQPVEPIGPIWLPFLGLIADRTNGETLPFVVFGLPFEL